MSELVPGAVFECVYPFVRATIDLPFEDGPHHSWKPGIEYILSNYSPDDFDSNPVADGEGKKISTVIEVVKLPRPYPSRVFFTVKWVAPDGYTFGKSKLHCTTKECFLRKATSFQFPYSIRNPAPLPTGTPSAATSAGVVSAIPALYR